MRKLVISLGGSLIHKSSNLNFLSSLKSSLNNKNFIIVTGGGAVARCYQRMLGMFDKNKRDLDAIGIEVTKLNAFLVSKILNAEYSDFKLFKNSSKRVVVGGLKPGVTTDFVAVKIAEKFKLPFVVNMSKIRFVRINGVQRNFISWKEYFQIIPKKNQPGIHVPFDIEASKLAKRLSLKVLFINNPEILEKLYSLKYSDLSSLKDFMRKRGTIIY